MANIIICNPDQGAEVISALERAEWHVPAGYDRLYLIREDDHAWTGIDATDDPADVETYRYRESAVAWLRGTEGPDGPIRSADIARCYREHPDEPYYDNCPDDPRCCGNCAHAEAYPPADPQDQEVIVCAIGPCDACGERPAVGIDDACSKWEPIEEGH